MPDHWKSLANKLGAPGVDMPETEETESTKPSSSAAGGSEKEAHRPERRPVASPSVEASTRPESATQGSTFRDAASSRSFPKPAQPREPISASEESSAVSSSDSDRSARPVPIKAESEKRRSSWDKLTKLFGLGSAEESSPDTSLESPSSVAGQDTSNRQRNEPVETTPNDALEALFSDAPRRAEGDWRSESSLRIVDDVTWEEDDVEKTSHLRDSSSASAETAEGDAPARSRRRRRRRRGAKDRDPEGMHSRPVRNQDEAVADSVDWSEDVEVEEPVESADSWSEPETFVTDDGGEEPEIAERRSSRRHRRGKREPSPEPLTDSASRDESVSRDATHRQEGSSRREASPHREGTSRREGSQKRSQGDKRPARESREHLHRDSIRSSVESRPVDDDDEIDEQDLDLSVEGEELGNKHRKIPSWSDSLESIIANNMDNHRRNEGGRDGGPRGRPRGRR